MTRSHRLISALLLATAATACGDNNDNKGTQPDAGVTHDASTDPDANIPPVDASPDPDAPVQPVTCDYTESADANNDSWYSGGTPENAGTLASSLTICGQIDNTHFNAQQDAVDVDAFTVTVPEGGVYATLSGPGLENVEDVIIGVYGDQGFVRQIGIAEFVDGYALFEVSSIPAGTYEFSVLAFNSTAASSVIPYKLQIHVDTRCPKIATAPDHVEGTDGGSNDVFVIQYNPTTSTTPTPNENDAPETTNITVGLGDAKRISGTLVEAPVLGEYKDADTFEFTTGAGVNQVVIRLNWDDLNDLDWFLFDTNGQQIATASFIRDGEDEYLTARVQPNTTYWLWTGLYQDYKGPTPYNLSLCGHQFTP